jgi:hypothetical protein
MGQKDPLTEWQREGFEMFGAMMKGIAQDFVRYVMHVQVKEQEPAKLEPKVLNLQTTSSDNAPGQSGFSAAAAASAAEDAGARPRRSRAAHVQAADGHQGRLREDAAERAVPVRVGQEVQAVPRRGLRHPARRAPCATSPTTCASSAAASTEAEEYLNIAEGRNRLVELEAEMQRPDLWDDADLAKRVNAEYANVKDDLTTFDGSGRTARGRRGAPRAGARGRRRVAGTRDRRGDRVDQASLDQLELRSLFTGEHDDADCIVQINAKDGGVDAQDFAEMLLRMYAEVGRAARVRRSAQLRLRGHRGRDQLGRVH